MSILSWITKLERYCFPVLACALAIVPCSSHAQSNLLANPGFEEGAGTKSPVGWQDVWSRDTGMATAVIDTDVCHSGDSSLKVVSKDWRDWSVGQKAKVSVKAGEIYTLRGWIKCQDDQQTQISLVTCDSTGAALNWSAAAVGTSGTHDWQQFSARLVIPEGCVLVQYRLTGYGTGTVWLDDAELVKSGDLAEIRKRWGSRTYALSNRYLALRFDPLTAEFEVTDRRTGRVWRQTSASNSAVVESVEVGNKTIDVSLDDASMSAPISVAISIPQDAPQVRVSLDTNAQMTGKAAFPFAFQTGAGDSLVVPMNEGMLFPVDDKSISSRQLPTYNGHGGLSMPWAGICAKNGSGQLLLVRTPDDAEVDLQRDAAGNLGEAPQWSPTRNTFGYTRKLTYVFFDRGGYVAQAKWYRNFAKSAGLFETLSQKRKKNPNVDLLIGAADVWCWEKNSVSLCKEMKSLGMDHVLWASGGAPDQIPAINKLGYLTGKYDQYQDVYPPETPGATLHADWPDDLVYDESGKPINGWLETITAPDGTTKQYQAGVCNSKRALDFASTDIPADLKKTPYTARFLDTDTASPWREDYNPEHPMSRTDDRRYRLGLLKYCSEDLKLVTGSETGIDPAVPYLDYFEGMMSISEYRPPNDGYDVEKIIEPTPDILKYQVGPAYRIPLFELVYHDCTVDYWYWGDYNNKIPAVWPKRDLFNVLYGTPPVFMFDSSFWQANKQHFVKSYKDICPLARRLGYAEMLSHESLTADHTVQRTTWASGTTVTVNFGDTPFKMSNGSVIKPGNWLVSGGVR